VISAYTDSHALPCDDGVAGTDDRFLEDCADTDDDGLGRVDDGIEELDSVGAEVGDGDGSSLVLVWLKFFCRARGLRGL